MIIKLNSTKISNVECIPTFADGGGPYHKPNAKFRDNLAPDNTDGEKLTVKGKVLMADCKTKASDAVIDIWQANASGNYEDEWYRGRVKSDESGNYTFETVVPSGYGSGTGYRPPHIHFKVFINEKEIITSQMFFPEARGRSGFDDAYIMELKSETINGKKVHSGHHNIILP